MISTSGRASLVVLVLIASSPASAQPRSVLLSSAIDGQIVALTFTPLPESTDEEVVLALVSVAPRCLYFEVSEVPVQLGGVAFQLKRVARLVQRRRDNGVCSESLATAYRPADFYYLASAASVVMHLPSGPLPWTQEAIDLARLVQAGDRGAVCGRSGRAPRSPRATHADVGRREGP